MGDPYRGRPLVAAAAAVTTSVAAVAASLPWHTTYAAYSSNVSVADAVAAAACPAGRTRAVVGATARRARDAPSARLGRVGLRELGWLAGWP